MDANEELARMRDIAATLSGPGLRTNAERAELGARLARHVETLDELLSHHALLPHAWHQPDQPFTVTITRQQLQDWAGRPLSDDDVDALDSCIPISPIPDAIAAIVKHALPRPDSAP